MQQLWTGRAAQVAAKYGEHAPMAAVCCNACRTCVSSNVLGLATAGVTAGAIAVLGVAKRLGGRS